MQTKKFPEGSIIFNAGDPLKHISLITEGDVEGSAGWHTFFLAKTDVLGLSDAENGVYTYTYTALSDVTLYQYPFSGIDALGTLAQKNPDAVYLFTAFMCRYISNLSGYISQLKHETEAVPPLIAELNKEYFRLCKLYNSPRSVLPVYSEVEKEHNGVIFPDWLGSYYTGISKLDADVRKAFFRGNPGISAGFLRRSIDDVNKIYSICADLHGRLRAVSRLMLSSEDSDLFSFVSQLHCNVAGNEEAEFALGKLMASLNEKLSTLAGLHAVSPGYYHRCLESYWDLLEESRAEYKEKLGILHDGGSPEDEDIILGPGVASIVIKGPDADHESAVVVLEERPKSKIPDDADDAPAEKEAAHIPPELNPELADSVMDILEYSEADGPVVLAFERAVRKYRILAGKRSSGDEADELRRDLTKSFTEVYRLVLLKSLNDPAPPTVVNMFLNFGYVDAALAGFDNAGYLFEIADTFKGDPKNGIYTAREWLASIYRGEHEPGLSEFDLDYKDYVRELKNSKKIDSAGEKRMLADMDARLSYEMTNAFPMVNRIIQGSLSKYCPVFSSHNIAKSLKDTLVKPEDICGAIEEIRSVDFSAFYRQTAYSNQKYGITSEQIHVEVLPNIILMPVAGTRGSMWQDVEGRVRTTPARMFLPSFLDGDLKMLLTRLTGEFRWEICRRVQGAHWNDVADPSLTSLYCDYLQFYMNNRDIPPPVRNEIRNELSAARNNYKSVFLSDYVKWIHSESYGLARLNNISLGIMMTFCPFCAGIRNKLKLAIRYNDALNKYNARQQKRVAHLLNLTKKITQSGKTVPPEIVKELEFWQM